MLYVYQAIGKSGRYVKGKAAAASISALREDLSRTGLALVDARPDVVGQILAALKPRSLSRGVLIDMFGYLRGLFSSRKLERATYEDVGYRYVAGNLHPDHDTLANFRKTFLAEIGEVFVQVLLAAKEPSPGNAGGG